MFSFNNKKDKKKKIIEDLKRENQEYLKQMQCFLDKVDNIENTGLKQEIIFQMLRCEKILIKIFEKELQKNNRNNL